MVGEKKLNKITWNKIKKLILLPNVEYDEYSAINQILQEVQRKDQERFKNKQGGTAKGGFHN